MELDMKALDAGQRYKIIGACITPRPIAWVTSLSSAGVLNVAPFSFFNTIGNDPPMIVLGMVAHPEKRLKDTPTNIRETGDFVVNLVSENLASQMNQTSLDLPTDADEAAFASVQLYDSVVVRPPRIRSAPASFECRMSHFIMTGVHQAAILAEVVHAHVGDEFITDASRLHIDVPAMQLVARMHGAGWYSRQTDMFEMLRPISGRKD